jgi:hypothetical protein
VLVQTPTAIAIIRPTPETAEEAPFHAVRGTPFNDAVGWAIRHPIVLRSERRRALLQQKVVVDSARSIGSKRLFFPLSVLTIRRVQKLPRGAFHRQNEHAEVRSCPVGIHRGFDGP